jgi:hypothetical protein
MFVSEEAVPVCLEPDRPLAEQDVIYIRPKMSYGVKQRLISKAAQISMSQGSIGGNGKSTPNMEAAVDVGAYQLALLTFNVVRWGGPNFNGVLCIEANIERLDPDQPLVVKVLEEIEARNGSKPSPNPVSISGGSEASKDGGAEQLETSISMSD